VFVDEGYCSAAAVELDPDTGCATYSPTDGDLVTEDDWDEEESDEWEEEESEDEDWLDDDDDDDF